MSRRPLPPYIRPIEGRSQQEPTATRSHEHRNVAPETLTSQRLDAAIAPYVMAGKKIISGATRALVEEAANHGFVGGLWDAEVVQQEIGGIIAKKIRDTIVLELTALK